DSGELLLAAQEMTYINRFQDLLAGAMFSGGLVVLVVGLAGGMGLGARAVGRIDSVIRAIERIIDGNLSERLPRDSRGGDLDRLGQGVTTRQKKNEKLL